MLSRDDRTRRWRKHGNCVSSNVIAKERDYVAVMSVGSPGGVVWHVVCPKLGYALPEVSHLTRLWPGIINRHFAQVSQEPDCRPSAFSEALTEEAVRRALGRIVSVWRYRVLLPIVPFCSPSSLVLHRRDFSLLHSFHTGILCRCCQFLVHCGQMRRRSTNVFCPVSNYHTRHGRLHIRQS